MSLDPIARLIKELSRLPGIGERTAMRLALYVLQQKHDVAQSLADSLLDVARHVVECATCFNLCAHQVHCTICQKPGRDHAVVAVVSSVEDLMALESSLSFQGLYHVLHGVLQPIRGIGPDQLRIKGLFDRIGATPVVTEIILATPASIEGEATALYIHDQLKDTAIKFSRIASGVPVGGDLQYADRLTLARALLNRQQW